MLLHGSHPVKQMTIPDERKPTRPRRVLSGGQTGVDRAALDVALELGIPCGGWCPRGRLAEDGRIDLRYPLQETSSSDYAERTRRNVVESDATLVITPGPPHGGSALAITEAERRGKPYVVLDLLLPENGAAAVLGWLAAVRPERLNVAGPRESEAPGVYARTRTLLQSFWAEARSVPESGE